MKKVSGASLFFRTVLFVTFVAGAWYCLYLISGRDLTSRESAFLGLLLAITSVLASWVVTHIYAESQYMNALDDVQEQHRTNLRMYALKAAEKVNNLSNELFKLSTYLEQELEYTDYHGVEEELHAKEERIESAIHIIRTLKSVNDTSLSDWEGVIGDELDQQREEREEKEQHLKSMIEKAEFLIENQRQDAIGTQKDTQALWNELSSMKKELRSAVIQLGGTTLPKKFEKKTRKDAVEMQCPSCGGQLQYRQRPLSRSAKAVLCNACGKKLISRYSEEGGFWLQIRSSENVCIKCPDCNNEVNAILDGMPGSYVEATCFSCSNRLRLIRTVDSIDVKIVNSPLAVSTISSEISREVLDLIATKLPKQPWPTGIHKIVAQQLGLSNIIVTRAINKLIKEKVFLPQISGTLYIPSVAEVPAANKAKVESDVGCSKM